ncbi:hypothetical protein B0H10DRAFT_1943967 [Mycena sp. CBHHK59/15]|nr:hypothetical protein B0H10DRAFT_1943967 [Mycena sp. CBHHK59/15]
MHDKEMPQVAFTCKQYTKAKKRGWGRRVDQAGSVRPLSVHHGYCDVAGQRGDSIERVWKAQKPGRQKARRQHTVVQRHPLCPRADSVSTSLEGGLEEGRPAETRPMGEEAKKREGRTVVEGSKRDDSSINQHPSITPWPRDQSEFQLTWQFRRSRL